jgi:hypothetical protein
MYEFGDFHPPNGQIHLWNPSDPHGANNLPWTLLHEGAHSVGWGLEEHNHHEASSLANICWMGD